MKKQRDRKATTQAIIEAAEDLFLEKGPAQTSMADIAAKVGVAQSLICYYFETKENLWDEVVSRAFSDLNKLHEGLREARDTSQPATFFLQSMSEYYSALLENKKLRKFILWIELLELDLPDSIVESFSRDAEYLATLQHQGQMRKDVSPYFFLLMCYGVTEWVAARKILLNHSIPTKSDKELEQDYQVALSHFVTAFLNN